MFNIGPIPDVKVENLQINTDDRGFLTELYRNDETDPKPVMAYVSSTKLGVIRGPHEHRSQADRFCFLGPAAFVLHLWDNRPSSPTYNNYLKLTITSPMAITIPPGVVHGYKNIGSRYLINTDDQSGLIINLPDRLYKGESKAQEVDEIRHESDPNSPFKIP